MISGSRREVDEIGALQGNYAAYSGHVLPTFREKLKVPSPSAKNPKRYTKRRFRLPPQGIKVLRSSGKLSSV